MYLLVCGVVELRKVVEATIRIWHLFFCLEPRDTLTELANDCVLVAWAQFSPTPPSFSVGITQLKYVSVGVQFRVPHPY